MLHRVHNVPANLAALRCAEAMGSPENGQEGAAPL